MLTREALLVEPQSAAGPRTHVRGLDDAQLVRATLANDQAAWRELMRRHADALREAAREASEGIGEADADDVVSDLWLSLIENDMRGLRAFDPSRGAALLSWLTIRLSQLVYRRDVQRASEPDSVSLVAAKKVAVIPPEATSQGEDRTLMKVEEVARRWGIDRKTVYAMIERGQLDSRRCGRLVRIPRKVIESFESQASVEPERHLKCR
jgi:excisionase family DNA binding protein